LLTIRLINSEKGRYYKIMLHRDLLGDILVTKIWGGLNNRLGRQVSQYFACEKEAEIYIGSILIAKNKRGYR
jgi:predicted DNA-binding WGR domain protein